MRTIQGGWGLVLVTGFLMGGCMKEPLPEAQGTEAAHSTSVSLVPLGTYATGVFDDSAAEIVAHDPSSQRLYVVNGSANRIDVLDVSNPNAPAFLFAIDVAAFGSQPNSVAKSPTEDAIAVAVQNSNKQLPGTVAFFDTNGTPLASVQSGPLPDMLTFTPNGRHLLVANEGEPNDDYTVDPEGSVTIVDVSGGIQHVTQSDVATADFQAFNGATLDPSIRIYGPGATVAQDLEPEYIAVSPRSNIAWVTLQENNALAIIDIDDAEVIALRGLGFKDHSRHGRGFDASNRDDAINIRSWPTRGMYQPDAIAVVPFFGFPFLITANEGDARDYDGFSEEARVKDVTLDPSAFPDAAFLQEDANLGRLKMTTANGDTDGDGDFDELFSYGARSFTVLTPWGTPIFDSGDQLEQITADLLPDDFNSTNDENQSFDNRSDDKGPEPEGVTVGKVRVGYRTMRLAFIGLERIGGIAVYDVTRPWAPRFKTYINNRDFTQTDPTLAGDLGPEGLTFIPASDSPNGQPLLVVANEVSGTTTLFQLHVN